MGIRKAPLKWRLRHYPKLFRQWLDVQVAKFAAKHTNALALTGELRAKYLFKDGDIVDYGPLSYRSVTNDFAGLLVDRLHTAGTDLEAMFWYHAAGTDNTAESSGDTALGSEVLRSTGSSTEASAQVYQSVGTLTFTSSNGILEHGLLNGDTSLARIMMDRSIFTQIDVNSSDQIEFTYQLTVQSGG